MHKLGRTKTEGWVGRSAWEGEGSRGQKGGGIRSNQGSHCRQRINYLIQLLHLKRIQNDGSSSSITEWCNVSQALILY